MSKPLVIIDSGGHARVVIEIAQNCDHFIDGIIDINFSGQPETIMGCSVLGGMDKLTSFSPEQNDIFIAIGDNKLRNELFEDLLAKGYHSPNLVHPTAIVSESCELADGILVGAGAILNTKSIIERGAIVNTGAIVEHEVLVASYAHVCPGSKIGGRTKIGTRSFVGIGSSVIDKLTIGSDVVIGAGSVVIQDIPDHSKVVGISKIVSS